MSEKSKRKIRQRNYDMDSLQIGTFTVDTSTSTDPNSNKLRIFFTERVIMYDFDYSYVTDERIRSNFLVAICVPFRSLTGICCKCKDIYFTLSEPPKLITGSSGVAPFQEPPPDDVDITNGQLANVLYHKISLSRAQGFVIENHLLSSDAMDFSKLLFDVTPQGRIVYNVDRTPSSKLPSSEESTRDAFEEDGEN